MLQSSNKPYSVLDERIRVLKRALQRELGRKPTTLQKALIDAAAVMQAQFETAATNPATTANDLVRLSGEARRARLDMLASFQAAARPLINPFDAYVQAHAKVAS